jgi:hypothetical protein
MRLQTGPSRYLTLTLALSLAWPADPPQSPPEAGSTSPAPAVSSAEEKPRPGSIPRVDAHPSRHVAVDLVRGDQAEDSDEEDDGCTPSPFKGSTASIGPTHPLRIRPHLLDPIPARTSGPLGVSCRLRC